MTANKVKELIGKPVEALQTPALVVDIEALDHNLGLLAGYFSTRRCRIRPHFKSHKCVTLARRQLAAGSASGMTCAKVSEAEKLVEGGIRDVLVANQVVGPEKVRRLALLNRTASVRVAVDSAEGVDKIGEAARATGVTVGVLVEVDIGMNRCGVAPGGPTLELAARVAETRGLRFDGLQCYEGHLVTLENYEERRQRVTQAMQPVFETRREIEARGLAVNLVSAGGSGTYDITGDMEGIDEVQCGSYALMDAFYLKVRPEFRPARYVLATVVSTLSGKAVADVGLKGMGCEYTLPRALDYPEAEALYVAEEHTPFTNIQAAVGQRLRILPPHGCTTNNLHGWLWITRNGIIEDAWPIEGRGCLE